MFPVFGFGAQIPPSYQVVEHVNPLCKSIENMYFRKELYVYSWLIFVY